MGGLKGGEAGLARSASRRDASSALDRLRRDAPRRDGDSTILIQDEPMSPPTRRLAQTTL